MKLATKLSLALAATFLVTFGASWGALRAAVLPQFERLEAENHARDIRRVEGQLLGMSRDLRSRVTDYAQWDDTYRYLRTGAPSFIRDNFPDDWFTKYDVDLLMFVDNAGRPLWSGLRNPRTNRVERAPRVFQNIPNLGAAAADDSGRLPVLWMPAGALVYATAPGARTDGTGAPAGVVVMGRFIRPAALANRVQLDVSLVTAQSALLSEHAGAFAAEPTESGSWKSPQARYSLIALRASNGDVAGAVLAQSPRRITALGQRAIDLAAGAIAIGAMISLALLWWLIHHFTIRRIANLERHLAQQNEVSDLRELRLAPSGDEIGALSETYNKLVRRLQEAQTTAQTATADKTVATNTNRMKSALMANISYRLRTPLTAMIGYSELIEEELSDTARMQAGADLQRIRALAQQVLKLANEIFELSNIDADKVELRPSAFSPAEIIVEITDNARAAAEVNETRIDVRIAADTGMAYTDEHRLRQCLANVIDNACKYTRQGVVSVTTGRARKHGRDWLTFKIADTGQGIAPENLARIFEPFAETGSEKGLGLAITQKLLTLLGGDIFVSSELGQGSVFVMRVPAILPESAEPESERRTG